MKPHLTVRDGMVYVTNMPAEIQEALIEATRFRPVGYQYTQLFKRGKTDGYIKLYKNGKVPAGLLHRVLDVLREAEIEYEIDHEEPTVEKPWLLGIGTVGVERRDYQDEAVEAGLLNPRGVIRAPTGAGKSAIALRLIVDRQRRALVAVPTIDLLYQFKDFAEAHLRDADGQPIKVGQLGDGVVDPRPITVATVRSAAKALNVAYEKYEYGEYDDTDDTDVNPRVLREWIDSIGTLIVDEAHILGAQTVYDITTGLPALFKYGFSASPWRDDGADLMIEAAVGEIIYRIEAATLVEDGFLVPPMIEVVDTSGWWDPAAWGQSCTKCGAQRQRTSRGQYFMKCTNCGGSRFRSEYTDAYREEIVENDVRNMHVANRVLKLSGGTLVLVKQVKHGKALQKLLPDSVFLSGKDDGEYRRRVLNEMRAGLRSVLVATTIADVGLDVPALQNLVLAGGGKSSTRHLQRIGRVARPYPGKDFARVIDFDDGHVHKWFKEQNLARRKIEKAEWGEAGLWV